MADDLVVAEGYRAAFLRAARARLPRRGPLELVRFRAWPALAGLPPLARAVARRIDGRKGTVSSAVEAIRQAAPGCRVIVRDLDPAPSAILVRRPSRSGGHEPWSIGVVCFSPCRRGRVR